MAIGYCSETSWVLLYKKKLSNKRNYFKKEYRSGTRTQYQ